MIFLVYYVQIKDLDMMLYSRASRKNFLIANIEKGVLVYLLWIKGSLKRRESFCHSFHFLRVYYIPGVVHKAVPAP